MVIHGLLVTCLDQLALIFNCLKWCFVCVFENVLKRGHCCGSRCNDPCWDVCKGVCLLKRFSMFLEIVFENVLWSVVLKNRQGFLFCKLASNQELSTLNFSKIFAMF